MEQTEQVAASPNVRYGAPEKSVLRIKYTNSLNAPGGFCMSVGAIVEFYDGGFRNPHVNALFYPLFGPYAQLHEIANRLHFGTAGADETYEQYFEVVEVPITEIPTHFLVHDRSGAQVKWVTHKDLMFLLNIRAVSLARDVHTYYLADEQFRADVLGCN